MILSSIGYLTAPYQIHLSRKMAQSNGATFVSSCGIKFCVPDQFHEMVKKSANNVVHFFGDNWPDYAGSIKEVIIDKDLNTTFFVSGRTLLINENDTSRLASSSHLSSWLAAYLRMLKVYKDNHCDKIMWRKKVLESARREAIEVRMQYLKSRGN